MPSGEDETTGYDDHEVLAKKGILRDLRALRGKKVFVFLFRLCRFGGSVNIYHVGSSIGSRKAEYELPRRYFDVS